MLGGSGIDAVFSMQKTNNGGYILACSTESNDGDVSGNHGNDDYWVVKLTSDNFSGQDVSDSLFSIVDHLAPAKATLQAGVSQASPGDIVTIPIYLKNAQNITQSGSNHLKTDINFNPTILLPDNYPNYSIKNGIGTLPLDSLPIHVYADSIIAQVKFIVGLGDAEQTPIWFSNYQSIGGSVTIDTISGLFTLTGVCHEGGARLINPNTKAGITAVKPNPASDELIISVNTIENGETYLMIYNSIGSEIYKTRINTQFSGSKEINLNVSDFSSGVYFIKFQSPTFWDYQKFIVGR